MKCCAKPIAHVRGFARRQRGVRADKGRLRGYAWLAYPSFSEGRECF